MDLMAALDQELGAGKEECVQRSEEKKEPEAKKPMPRNVVPRIKPDVIPLDGLIVINGRKGSGKTTMMYWLLSKLAHNFDAGRFVSDSMHTIMKWRKNLPSCFIFSDFDVESVNEWIQTVKDRNDARTAQGKPMRKYLLILDDLGFDKKSLSSKPMMRLLQNARQVGVSIWIITQYLYQLTQQMRDAVDFAICFREVSVEAVDKIKKNFFDILGKDFQAVYKVSTGRKRKRLPNESQEEYDRSCPPRALCINTRLVGGAETWQDCVFCAQADMQDIEKPWRLANDNYYTFSDMTFVSEIERRAQEKKLKDSYARSEVCMPAYNDDALEASLGEGPQEIMLEDDYYSLVAETGNEDGKGPALCWDNRLA